MTATATRSASGPAAAPSGAAPTSAPTPGPSAPRPALRPKLRSLQPGELLVLAVAGLLPVVATPQVYEWFFTPKAALLLPVVVPGLVVLVAACRARDVAAWAAAAFVAWAAVATVLAPAPGLALIGAPNLGTGWLFVAALAGMWALGRRLGADARRALEVVLLVAAGCNALVGWVQMTMAPGIPMLDPFEGRAGALLGNPVHVATLEAAALVLVVERCARAVQTARRDRALAWLGAATVAAGAVELSGGRAGLLLVGVVVLAAVIRCGWRIGAAFLLAVLLGIGAAAAVATSSTGAAERTSSIGSAGLAGRGDRWALAGPAVAERPLTGFGPGQFRRATSRHTTAAAARAFGPDTLSNDAHNVLVEYTTTTGLVGVALLAAWLVLAGRRARGPLGGFAAIGALGLLLQPQTVGLTPVIAVALGAAGSQLAPRLSRTGRGLVIGGAVVGVAVAVVLITADGLLERAYNDVRPSDARRAAHIDPWSTAPRVESRAESVLAVEQHSAPHRRAAVAAARDVVDRDPSDPNAWTDLGALEAVWGSPRAATHAFQEALRWNPWSTRALRGLARQAAADGDEGTVLRSCARVHEVLPAARCPNAR